MLIAGRSGRGLLLAAALLAGTVPSVIAADGTSGDAIPPAVSQFLQSLTRTGVVAPTTGATPAIGKAQPGALIAGSVRLRVSLSSAQFGDVALYAARTERGVCFVMLRGGRPSGECSGDNVPARSPVVIGYNANPAGWNLVDGHTYSSTARTLRVHFKQGSSFEVPVSGRFFVFELGPEHSSRSTDPPVSLDVLDAGGKTLGTRVDPLRLAGRPQLASALASSVELRAQLTLPGAGGHVTLSSGRDGAGSACMRLLLNGRRALPRLGAWQCGPAIGHYDFLLDQRNPKLVHRVPVSWTLGRSGNLVLSSHSFAYGYVAPTIRRLEVRFQDGKTAGVALHAGYFAYAIPASAYVAGHRPSLLRAFSAAGKPIYTQRLYPKRPCVYPGLDAACGGSSSGSTVGGAVVISQGSTVGGAVVVSQSGGSSTFVGG
jgi:hypothetical protein